MKREDLQKLDLTDDQIEKVMKLHGADIQAGQKMQEALTAMTTERDGLKEQITQRDKDLKAIKKSAADSEELTTKLNDLQSKYDTDTKTLNEQLASSKMSAALTTGLAGSGARDISDIQRFLDTDKLQLGADGKVAGLDDQLKILREQKAYLFTGKPKAHYDPSDGKATEANIANLIKNPEANLTEALKENKGE